MLIFLAGNVKITTEEKYLRSFIQEVSMMESGKLERSSALSAWLTLVLIANGLTAFVYSLFWLFIKIYDPGRGGWALPALAVMAALTVIFIIAVFKWKKWGLYGFAFTTLVSVGINSQIGVNQLYSVFGLIGVAVLWYFIRPYWANME